MAQDCTEKPDFTPDLVLQAYAQGIFPMADSAENDAVYWYDPMERGQLPIAELHIPKTLLKTLRRHPFEIKVNTAFAQVMMGCASREKTWINKTIYKMFCDLHSRGFAHSVEAWKDGKLAGGLYGLALGGAFFGESMFSRETDASKICLVHLAARLYCGGFVLLDTQFINEHLLQFGAYKISRQEYQTRLQEALKITGDFYCRRFFSTPSKDGSTSVASSSVTSPSPSKSSPSVASTGRESSAVLLEAFLQSRTQTS